MHRPHNGPLPTPYQTALQNYKLHQPRVHSLTNTTLSSTSFAKTAKLEYIRCNALNVAPKSDETPANQLAANTAAGKNSTKPRRHTIMNKPLTFTDQGRCHTAHTPRGITYAVELVEHFAYGCDRKTFWCVSLYNTDDDSLVSEAPMNFATSQYAIDWCQQAENAYLHSHQKD